MDKMIEFQKIIPITKAYKGDDGELYIEGESSGPELDLDKQFMTTECISGMAEQVNKSPVPYLDEHQKKGVASELGTVVAAEVTPQYHMKTTTKLDRDNPIAVTLWNKVQKGKKFGQSIAGHVAGLATKVIDGVTYKGFSRITLDHIANTTKPSWAPSLGTLVAKSLEDDEFDWTGVPEYAGELPFGAFVQKGSTPDPQAGKWYTLAEDILSKLNQKFGWASYQDMIDETNRDNIPLQSLPIAAQLRGTTQLPGAAVELSVDDYDNDPEGYIQKMEYTMGTPEEKAPLDVQQMADLYQRLYWLVESLGQRDVQTGTKDGKKIVTRLKSAMASLAEAMKETLAKSQKPPMQPEVIQKVQEPAPAQVPSNMLKSFDDVGAVGQASITPHPPQPSVVGGGTLTDFSQVAQTTAQPQIVAKVDDLAQLLGEFGGAVQKAYGADAPVDDKRQALVHIVRAFAEELGGRLETQRPEEERLEKTIQGAIAPLMAKIEQLEAQLAVTKSQPSPQADEAPLVRKSLPGKRVVLQPARVVRKSDQRPTFVDLVTGQGGLLNE